MNLLVGRKETRALARVRESDVSTHLGNGELLVVGLLRRDDGGVGREHEVDAGVGDEVGLLGLEIARTEERGRGKRPGV